MTTTVTKPAINLREMLSKLAGLKPAPRRRTVYFTGNSATTTFAVPHGFAPTAVYVDGARWAEGALDDYTVTHDGFTYSVVMAVAPAAVKIIIDIEEVQK